MRSLIRVLGLIGFFSSSMVAWHIYSHPKTQDIWDVYAWVFMGLVNAFCAMTAE